MFTLREPQGERDQSEVTSKYPFMLSLVEACSQFFNSLLYFNIRYNLTKRRVAAKSSNPTSSCRIGQMNKGKGGRSRRSYPRACSFSSGTDAGSGMTC